MRQESYWIDRNERDALIAGSDVPDDVFDVAVVGAGVVGTTVALACVQRGRKVVVIDAERDAGYGVSGQATAKVTVGMGVRAAEVARMHGADTAAELLRAAVDGCAEIHARADELGDVEAYAMSHEVYATEQADAELLTESALLARDAQIKAVELDPVKVNRAAVAAVRYPGQLIIDPVRYVRGLLRLAALIGCKVVMSAPVRNFESGDPHRLITDRGVIKAREVVLATHIPILNRTLAFAAVIQRRHFAVAGIADRPVSMTYDVSGRQMSSRPASLRNRHDAIVVGASMDTGHGSEVESMHAVCTWAETTLGMRLTHSWSSQDAKAIDGLPLVGPSMGAPRLWIATGFDGWGFTLGTAAGLDIAAQIAGRESRVPSWNPSRASLARGIGDLTTNLARTAKGFAIDPLTTPVRSLDDTVGELHNGQGAVVRCEDGPCAVCRDSAGQVHVVSARCTHLGCFVRWDAQAQSWDCPCHGSRFAPDGAVLHGPATKPLEQLRQPAK